MTLLQHYQLGLTLITVVTVALSLWVFIWRWKNRVARFFFLYSLAVAWWAWCQAQASFSSDPATALSWIRMMFYGVILFPVLATHFFSALLEIDQRKVCLIEWLLVAAFLPFLSSEYFLQQGGPLGFLPSFPKSGPLFLPFNLTWLAWFLYDLWLLAKGPKSAVGQTRRQAQFLLGAYLFGFTTGCNNWLYAYGICLPPFQPFGSYGLAIAFLIIAYGIFSHALFDIHIVVRRSLVYSILITLLTVGYFGFVYVIERFFQTTLGYRSIGFSLSAFALMALLFQPLKISVQRLVDWCFFRAPHEELVRRMERLEREVQQADKLKAVSTLAAGLAHEIKNPLTSIKAFTEALGDRYDDPIFREKFQKIVGGEVARINLIVTQLLEFAKPAAPHLEATTIAKLLDETLDLLNSETVRRRIEVERAYGATDAIQADPQQLRQVFLNLFLNSLEAMNGSGGRLAVSMRREGSRLTVAIEDSGAGISKEHLSHIFDPFFTTKSAGTGLGLSIVRSIITEHHGTIAFESQPHHGTTCTLTFPLSDQ